MPDPELSSFTTVFRASDQHRIKRNRQAVSCLPCQKRKSRCDRKQPCGSCEKRGEASFCRLSASGHPAATNGRNEVQTRLDKLEEMVRGLAQSSQNVAANVSRKTNGVNVGIQDSHSFSGADASYHGPTSWTALVDSIRDIQVALHNEGDEEAPDLVLRRDPDVIFGSLPQITLDDVLDSLPTRQDSDRMLQLFFNSRFLSAPFIHGPQFRRRYEAFLENPSQTSFLWISMLFSILSVSSMIIKVRGIEPVSPQGVADSSFYMTRSAQCLLAGDYLGGHPLAVESILMHGQSRNVQKQDSDSSLWSLFGLAIRLGQRQGYHRDPSKLSKTMSPFNVEMRRRTWFLLQSMDLLFSWQHGMPPMIHTDLCDTKPPTNLLDEDFDEDTVFPPARPPTDPHPILAHITKYHLCRIVRKIFTNALATEPKPYSETVALQKELEEYYASVPPCLQARSIRSTSFTDANYTVMHRLMLEMVYLKAQCVLHRPYLTAYKDNPEYERSRSLCSDAALQLINIHMEFDQEIKPGGRMYEDRYMVSSLTLHDFLIAAMVLCIDLTESMDRSPEYRAVRLLALHKSNKIWSSRKEDSRDAWHAARILRAILNKVESPGASSDSSTLVTTSVNDFPASDGMPKLDTPRGMEAQIQQNPYAHEWHMNFDDIPSFDTYAGDIPALDWNTLDNYIRFDSLNDQSGIQSTTYPQFP